MKLFIVLSLIACGYGAKLDRTYLPPSSAATAGGSPGSLNAPLGHSGSTGIGQPAATSGFGQPAAFGPTRGSGFGKSISGPAFGSQPSGVIPAAQYGQPGSPSETLDSGFSQVAQNFGPGSQNYQTNQPQRAQTAAEQSAEILRLDNQNDGETFSYSFETSNGIAAEESGVATNGVQAQGAFSYSDDDGQNFRVTYTADENGYQPQGDHLPTPHPIPADILKSIEKNAQAAATGTQEGAYNPDEDNSDSAPQQYNYDAPNSYSQGSSSSGSYNQQGNGPSKLYGAPNAGGSRPQSGAQGFQSQSSSQQYGAPTGAGSGRSSNAFDQSQRAPSQTYGSPSNELSGVNGASQARPNSFGQNQFQPQGPSQQYGAPSRPSATGGSNGFGPSANVFTPSGSASQSRPNQYQTPQSGFPSARQLQGSAQIGQAQDDSGYQYDRPQGSFGVGSNGKPSNQGPVSSRGPAGNQGPAGQYRPQNGGSQPSRTQGSFPSPNGGSTGYPSGPAQGSFGPSSGPSSQGSFGPTSDSGAFGSTSGPKGRSSFGPSTGSAGQGYFGSTAQEPSSFGPANGQFSSSPSGTNGFGRSQGSFDGTKGPMTDSGYTYNRPGSQAGAGLQAGAGSQPQGGSNAPGLFGGPRQPPSFSEEEGYKY